MRYEPPLLEARLIKRYKRFLADIQAPRLPEGATQLDDHASGAFTAHCANPGSMRGVAVADARVWIQDSRNPKRKLRYSLELIETPEGARVCVNTARANQLVGEALQEGGVREVAGSVHRAEVKWSGVGSAGEALEARFDFALWSHTSEGPHTSESSSAASLTALPPSGYLEVKSVTYAPDPVANPGLVAFPDAVTARGLKHLQALSAVARSGGRAVLLFCVNRDDAREVTIAEEVDPAYAAGIRVAIEAGVEVIAYATTLTPHEQRLGERLPFHFE